MAKGAAKEGQLAALHNMVAQVLAAQLGEKVVVNLDEVEDEGADPVEMYTASPALLTVASRFLKDNNIEADLEAGDSEASEVQRRLAEIKKNRGKVVRLGDLDPVADER